MYRQLLNIMSSYGWYEKKVYDDLIVINLYLFISGHPIPDLTWWLGGNLIDSQYYLAHKDTVINDLENFKVLRHMDGAIIECKANNTHVSNPTIRSLALDMHCK